MATDLRAERLLSRASFGARPGDAAALRREGSEAWLARNLAVGDDPSLDRRLAAFPNLGLSPGDAVEGMDLPRMERGGEPRLSEDAKRELRRRTRDITAEVAGARIVRAVHGSHPLREVMIDFWANHFSVFARKHPIALVLPHYQREVIEPHALGRFGDLLAATARSPAMLFYLDNWISTAPRVAFRRRRGRGSGINENYARELLELHTLGVDGGYAQDDVREVARVFTGWTLQSRRHPVFRFREILHDDGRKIVLGERVRGYGMDEGVGLLQRLARHPSTARHLARKLVARFVSDAPPPALVRRVARRFLETDGDIPEVVSAILLSREFADPHHRKLKTPLRFAASAVRTTGGETDGGPPILFGLGRLGEVPFFARTPAGFPEGSAHWVDPGAVLERMTLAFALARGRIRGTRLGEATDTAPGSGLRGFERQALSLAGPEFQWA